MKNHKKSERGQALILIVFAIIGLIGMTGLTVDGGMAFSDRRNAQNAADTAALAAGRAKVRLEDWVAAGEKLAEDNGYVNGVNNNLVEVISPPTSGTYAGDTNYIQVNIVSNYQTTFARVVGITQMTNRVTAVAQVVPSTYVNMFDGNAVVSLNPHGCKAFKFQGSADVTVTGGGIFVNSDCNDNGAANSAAFSQSGKAEITASSMCAIGKISDNGGLDIPSQSNDCEPYDYPLSKYVLPLPDCGGPTTQNGNILSPGDHSSGTFPPDGVTFLEPGVYCVTGDFRVNKDDILHGSDVVIYMINGDVQWNGGAEVQLDAPNEGPFKGLVIYMPYENDGKILLNGNADASEITGTILAPSALVQINGTGDGGINGQIIGYEVDMSGDNLVTINYDDEQNYEAKTPPSIELAE